MTKNVNALSTVAKVVVSVVTVIAMAFVGLSVYCGASGKSYSEVFQNSTEIEEDKDTTETPTEDDNTDVEVTENAVVIRI